MQTVTRPGLLLSRFYVPPTRVGVVPRPRLTEKLLAGINRTQMLTLSSGPAGSGKITLLSDLVVQVRQPVAYLIAACQSYQLHNLW